MARLHEFQGKTLLSEHGVVVPEGRTVRTPDEARRVATELGGRLVLKVQAWITGRAALGGVRFAATADEAASHAAELLEMRFGNFPVEEVLVERALDIRHELFVSFSIDDASMAPVLLLDPHGGSGIEDRAATVSRIPVDVRQGVDAAAIREALRGSPIDADRHAALAEAVVRLVEIARSCEARSLEVNPLVVTADGSIVAADCRVTVDDYAVFRHPELGIEIARELDHPPTPLEKVAYQVEGADHRGTFYFAQLPTDEAHGSRGVIGFHGAGGGGSMMSMDAVTNAGFTIANFCDTSGNPSAAKVYRAARIILSQPGLVGYFGSGSGVASQEQYHSAYGLSKAFIECNLPIPAVVRLGGNSEDRAVQILEDACRNLPGRVEGFKKDDTPAACAERFAELVQADASGVSRASSIAAKTVPSYVDAAESYRFDIEGGTVWIDHAQCDERTTAFVIEHGAGLLVADAAGRPVVTVGDDEIRTKDSELIGLEVECRRAGRPVVFVDLDIPGLE